MLVAVAVQGVLILWIAGCNNDVHRMMRTDDVHGSVHSFVHSDDVHSFVHSDQCKWWVHVVYEGEVSLS